MPQIHPTAIIGERVSLGEGVTVGPHALIEDDVIIGARTQIGAGAFVGQHTELGTDNQIGFHTVIGADPQILNWSKTDSRTLVGSHNVIREFATIHRAKHSGAATIIGNHNFIMALAHVAHDCVVGDHIVICNGVLLAGHVVVGDRAFISGNCPIHQFVRIGRFAMIRGLTAVGKDVPPFTLIDQTNTVRSLNAVALRRSGLSAETRQAIKEAYRVLFRTTRPLAESLELLELKSQPPEVREMIDFIRTSERGVCRARPASLKLTPSPDDDGEDPTD